MPNGSGLLLGDLLVHVEQSEVAQDTTLSTWYLRNAVQLNHLSGSKDEVADIVPDAPIEVQEPEGANEVCAGAFIQISIFFASRHNQGVGFSLSHSIALERGND